MQSFFAALRLYQPDSLILTPALLAAIVSGVEQGLLDSQQFKLLAIGGAKLPLPLESKALALGLPLVHGYGLSEFCSVVALNSPDRPVVASVGKPLPHAQVTIDEGEVVVSGNCMLGYLGEPDFWYPKRIRTGDLGSWDAEGNLRIGGRIKNIIITAFGRNVDPEWPEALLSLQPNIRQAAIWGSEELPITALLYSLKTSALLPLVLKRLISSFLTTRKSSGIFLLLNLFLRPTNS